MFFILRGPVDSLATAVITYRNEDRLTQKGQQLSQDSPTSRQWMVYGDDPSIYQSALLQASSSSSPTNLKDLDEAQPPSTVPCRNLSPVGIFNLARKPAAPKWAIVAVETGEAFARCTRRPATPLIGP